MKPFWIFFIFIEIHKAGYLKTGVGIIESIFRYRFWYAASIGISSLLADTEIVKVLVSAQFQVSVVALTKIKIIILCTQELRES